MFGIKNGTIGARFLILAATAISLAFGSDLCAEIVQQAVGGISVDVSGVLNNVDPQQRTELKGLREQALQAVPADLAQPTKLRSISLKKLEAAIEKSLKSGTQLSDDVKYLAGLQRVQYVFVYPDQKDVVIAGPAEGWRVNQFGEVVGVNSGRPVLHLDDLVVALRCADAARSGGISVSIDPTAEGVQRLSALIARQKGAIGPDPQATIHGMEEALGTQTISIAGVPLDSRFASVMVAADYRMKRLGMNMDPSPVPAMKSYLEMLAAAGHFNANMLPRWWLAPRYEPLQTDGEGTAWELRGPGVRALAEEDMVSTGGERTKSVKASAAVEQWADSMTAHYDELAAKDSVFGDLRNCMDLAVIGALIAKEHLFEKADLHLTNLMETKQLPVDHFNPPRQVDSRAAVVQCAGKWAICVSGGVQVQPWQFVQEHQKSDAIAGVRHEASTARTEGWYWNAN